MKEQKNQIYSTKDNLVFFFKEVWKYDKRILVHIVLAGISEMFMPLARLGLTAIIIDAVADGQTDNFFVRFAGLILVVLILTILAKTSMTTLQMKGNAFRVQFMNKLSVKLTDIDFSLFDGNEGQEKINKASGTADSPEKVFQRGLLVAEALVKNVLGLLVYSFLLAEIHWGFIILVAGSSLVNFFYSVHVNKKEDQNKEKVAPINRKLNYIKEKTGEFNRAKDMRMYKMEFWFGEVFEGLIQQKFFYLSNILRKKFIGNTLSGLFTLFIDLVAYVYLIQLIIAGEISVASFTVYFGAIATLSNWISGTMNRAVDINKMVLEIDDFREFMNTESQMNHGKGISINLEKTKRLSIEFDRVSYRYPESEEDTIKDFSVKIEPGEKIALVGINGAGKSTLIKLLTGLYRPTEGTIKVNGYAVDEYNVHDYYDLFSVVFQDYYELPITLEEMVIQGKDKDMSKLDEIESRTGLKEILNQFPEKGQTRLVKRVYSDAVDLSGGQKQTLQLAKALYKDGPILVLDEPTAALDPIAESNIYNQYEELSKEKTSIFISHRLASTRFCDRILFMENGNIVEQGTHSELMEEKGKYYDMFEAQSYYYKNEVGESYREVI
jgi:ABC-type multidrug transport system fused ATPase/permease subunit